MSFDLTKTVLLNSNATTEIDIKDTLKLFEKDNLGHLVMYNEVTSDTVENAAKMIGCKEEQIAKTMAFYVDEQPIVIVSIGEAKIDNAKYNKESYAHLRDEYNKNKDK